MANTDGGQIDANKVAISSRLTSRMRLDITVEEVKNDRASKSRDLLAGVLYETI